MAALSYKFGPFRLEVAEQRLLRDGRPVVLRAKLFDTLRYLVERHGSLVEKDELMHAVWPDANVEEANLAHNVSMLRKALGEEAERIRYIETVPKRGYRFVDRVVEVGLDEPRTAVATASTRVVSARPSMPATRYARSGHLNIAYQVLGDGPIDLVYVPGWVTHLEYGWREPRVERFLRRLATFSRLILFDKRGTGLSDRVPEFPTLEDRMDDVRVVMDAVGSKRAAIFGASEGGSMSLLFAATYPERTCALVLAGVFAKRLRSHDYPWAPSVEIRQAWFEKLEREWGGPVDLESLAPSLLADERFAEWWATYLRLGASPGAVLALAKFNTQIDTRDVLSTIRVPTLVLHRAGDREVLVEEARYIAARIPDASLVVLPGDDHLIYAGDTDALADEIERFLSEDHTQADAERVLATILCVKSEGGADVATWESFSARHRGRALRYQETGHFYATFDGPGRAIRCALTMAADARARGRSVRIGIHTGECELASPTLGGIPIAAAARLAATANVGEVLVTGTVKDLVSGSGLRFTERGMATLAELNEAWPVFVAADVESQRTLASNH